MITTIDLKFRNIEKAIACFLIKGPSGYILVETGPESTWPTLKKSLDEMGVAIKEIKGVLLTHIHLDHSGGAWQLAKQNIPIYVHSKGAPHLINTERLWSSAGKIYGAENMTNLWGELQKIDVAMVHSVADGEKISLAGLTIEVFYTPGHASHHVVYEIKGQLFTGDLLGACIDEGPSIIAAPPPDLNIEIWIDSIKKISKNKFSSLVFTHFGAVEQNVESYYERVIKTLSYTKEWMEKNLSNNQEKEKVILLWEKENEKILGKENNEKLYKQYVAANPPFMSVLGFKDYLQKMKK